MPLDRDTLLTAARRDVIPFDVPGLGQVCLRALTGAEVSEIYASLPKDAPDYGAQVTRRLVARTICDEQGTRILLLDDAEALFDKSASITTPLANRCLKLNRMSAEDDADTGKG